MPQESRKTLNIPPLYAKDMYISRASRVFFHIALAVAIVSILSALATVLGFFLILVAWVIAIFLILLTFGAIIFAAPGFFDMLSGSDGVLGGMFSFVGWLWKYTAPVALGCAVAALVLAIFDKRWRSKAIIVVSGLIIVAEIVVIAVSVGAGR